MPVWVLHIAGLLTITRQISFLFFMVYCNRGNIKNSISVTENLRIFFTCTPNLLCGHSDYSFVDVLHAQESIESANTTIEDEDVKGWSIFLLNLSLTVRCFNSRSFDTLLCVQF